jgi:hypothetical protein
MPAFGQTAAGAKHLSSSKALTAECKRGMIDKIRSFVARKPSGNLRMTFLFNSWERHGCYVAPCQPPKATFLMFTGLLWRDVFCIFHFFHRSHAAAMLTESVAPIAQKITLD